MNRAMAVALAALMTAAALWGYAAGREGPAGRIAFVRGGDLWLWEAGQEQPLTRGQRVAWPRFSPDGRWIAYWQDGATRVMGVRGEGPWRLDQEVGLPEPVWSPVDSILALTAKQGVSTVALTDAGPGDAQLVAAGASGPAWSPDGEQLAVMQDNAIAVVPRTGGQPRTVLPIRPRESRCDGPATGIHALAWSADGRWLSFYRMALGASASTDCQELTVVPSAGGEPTVVGLSPGYRNWRAWGPVGAVLAFTDGTGRDAWIDKTVRWAVMPPRRPFPGVTPPGYADREPAWAPDGRRLAFARSRAEFPGRLDRIPPEQAIWVADTASGEARPVPGSDGGMAPRWGRDGSLIWVNLEPEGSSLRWTPAPGQPPRPVIRGVDRRPFSYYGQWGWEAFFDWWSPPPGQPAN